MKKSAILLAAAAITVSSGAFAQACRAVTTSCSQIYASCQQRCTTGSNPARCVAQLCETPLQKCKSTGVWSSSVSNACFETKNRS